MSTPTPNRRQVLKGSLAASAALAAMAIPRSVRAAGSDTIRIGMVGCGGRCSGAARDAMDADPGTKLVAMTDLFPDRVQAKLASLKTQKPAQVDVTPDRCFSGLDGYKRVIENVDVVLIACAAKFHPMYTKAAIEAGKHVFVEKPHGIDPLGIKVLREAIATSRQKNLGILSGLQSRFHESIQETMQRIHDGQIGEIIAMEENFVRPPYGSTVRPPAPMRDLEIQYGNQYRFSWMCGDDVTQSLVHNVDRATWAMKEQTPVKCHGFGGRSTTGHLLGDVFDHHSVVYQYANGVRLYALCRTTPGCYNENSSIIMGSKGAAYPLTGTITGDKPWKYSGKQESPYVAEHRAFLASIRAGKPINCGDYMAQSTMVVIMGQLSCYSGQEITWDRINKSTYSLGPKPEDCTWEMEPPTKADEKGEYPVCATPGVTRNV